MKPSSTGQSNPKSNVSVSVSLRRVKPSDDAFVFRVYGDSRAVEMAAVPWSDEQKTVFLRFQFEAQQNHYSQEFPNARYDVILRDGHPVGRLYVDRRAEEIRILDIAVLSEHRKQGTGTKLVRDLMEEAASANKRVNVYVETFQPSISLFERLGFTVSEDHEISVLMEWKP